MSSLKRCHTAIAFVLVATLVGCGSSQPATVTPGAYVKSICQAVGPFESDVEARSSALNLTKLTDATQGKRALQQFLSSVARDSEQAITRLKAAGTPKVSNGKAIAGAVVRAFTELKTTIDRASVQAQQLSTTNTQSFKNGAQALGSTVRSSLANIGAGLGGLRNPTLEKAAASEPACQSLGT